MYMKRRAMICIQKQNVSSVALFKDFTVNWPWSFKERERSHNHIYYICLISNTGSQGLQKNILYYLAPVLSSQGDSVIIPRVLRYSFQEIFAAVSM